MRKVIEKIKEYSLKLWSLLKLPRSWVFIVVAIVSYFVITFVGSRVIDLAFNRERIVPQSKLSGLVCKDYDKRPIAVTLASDPQAKPLSGLSTAEFVFEIPVTPSGITRLMAVYQCSHPKEIGSIRSARDGFISLAMGLDAILAHWGGEARALERLDNGVMDNINALIYEGSVFYRKKGARPPHNGFTSFNNLLDKAEELGYETEAFDFVGYPHLKGRKNTDDERKVVRVYDSPYNVEWFYGEDSNTYSRYVNGVAEIDALNDRQVEANVIIVVKTTSNAYSVDYLDIDVIGSGEATVYQNGTEIKGQWRKTSDEAPLEFLDLNDKPIELMPGITWVEFIT